MSPEDCNVEKLKLKRARLKHDETIQPQYVTNDSIDKLMEVVTYFNAVRDGWTQCTKEGCAETETVVRQYGRPLDTMEKEILDTSLMALCRLVSSVNDRMIKPKGAVTMNEFRANPEGSI